MPKLKEKKNLNKLLGNIQKHITKNPGFNNKLIAQAVMHAGDGAGYKESSIARRYVRIAKSSATPDHVPRTPDKLYSDYEAEIVHAAYTKKGANLTWIQVLNLGLVKAPVAAEIKKDFKLTKDHEPYPASQLLTLGTSEIQSRVADRVYTILEHFVASDTPSINGAVRQLKKELFNAVQSRDAVDDVVEDLKAAVKDIDFLDIVANKIQCNTCVSEEITVIIGDMHLGMKGRFFSYDAAKQALSQILAGLPAACNINVVFLGDIIHTVTGTNHKNTWQDILFDKGYGANGIIEAYKLLLWFLAQIRGLQRVSIVGGNHDRLTSDRNEDQDDGGAHIIAEFLNVCLPVQVDFDPMLTKFDVGRLRMLNRHGDERADLAPAKDMYIEHAQDKDVFLVINIGHLHHLNLGGKEQGENYIKCYWPAFCPKDKYAERGGYNSAFPGWGIIREVNGKPQITISPLTYKEC